MINEIIIEDEVYTKEKINSMNLDELKMLVSFVESENVLRRLQKWSNNIHFILYLDNLIDKSFPIK